MPERLEILALADLQSILKATDRELIIVKRKRDQDFVKLYGKKLRNLIMFRKLAREEMALLLVLLPFIDYGSNFVLSPQRSFDENGNRKPECDFATVSDMVELTGWHRRTVLKALEGLQDKGLANVVETNNKKLKIKLIHVDQDVAFKGNRKRGS